MGRSAVAELIIHLPKFSLPKHTPRLLHPVAWSLERLLISLKKKKKEGYFDSLSVSQQHPLRQVEQLGEKGRGKAALVRQNFIWQLEG